MAEAAFATARKRAKLRALLIAFVIIANFAAMLWGLYLGTQAVVEGRISAGHLGQTIVYVIILASAFAVLGEVYGDLLRAAGATERLMELLASQSPIQTPVKPITPERPQAGSRVDFEAVDFHYPSRPTPPALSQFTLSVRPGQTVAIVGPSGAGKTTVFQLLLRFYDPAAGRIALDGSDIRQMALAELRQRVGIVPQDAVVFSSSALENIRYGRPDASDAEVHAAARAAFAHDFITALPQGYDTFLGERGVRLSGGQRQRIAIARALAVQPRLIVCDEPTSALDVSVQAQVLNLLCDLQREQNYGYLMVSHNLDVIRHVCDRVYVMEKGRFVEDGPVLDVMERPSHPYTRTLIAATPFG